MPCCPYCDRIFKLYSKIKRHHLVCSNVAKLKFPGGFHQSHQTFFDELEKFGIYFGQKIFRHFITYDFEAVLQKLATETNSKLIWE